MCELISASENFLPFDLPYMTDELKRRAETELFEDDTTKTECLKLLRTTLEREQLYYKDEEAFLQPFLRVKKYDVLRAFNLIKSFYNMQIKHKDMYNNLDIAEIRKAFLTTRIGFLPFRDNKGCCLLYITTENWDPNEYSLGQMVCFVSVGVVYASLSPSTQVAGVKIIFDLKGFTASKLPHVTIKYLRFLIDGLQNCIPARVKGIYIVNENRFVPHLWALAKYLFTSKMRERVHFCGRDMTIVHQHFSPKILPKELDGDLPLYDNTEWVEKFCQAFDYIFSTFCLYSTSNADHISSAKKCSTNQLKNLN